MSDDNATRGMGRKDSSKPKPKKLRKNHLLIIGIDKYSNGISPLNNAVRDAKGFKKILLDRYQFEEANVKELYNEAATKDAILDTFDQYWNTLTDDDNLVIYFSGHGEVHKFTKKGYWIPVDAELGTRSSYLPNAEVLDFFKYLKAHHVFGIVDSCFSGTLFQTRKLSTQAERLDNIPSRWLLTAGRLELVSDGSLGANSPFATSLLTHLKGNESNSFWASQLCDRVLSAVTFNAEKQTPRGEPLQNAGHQGGQFVFYQKDYVPVISDERKDPVVVVNEPSRELGGGQTNAPVVPPPPKKEPSTFDELIITLKEEMAMDNFDSVFDRLKDVVNPSGRQSTNIILFQARYNRNKNKEMGGLDDPRDIQLEYNRLRQGLLHYIDKMDREDLKPDVQQRLG